MKPRSRRRLALIVTMLVGILVAVLLAGWLHDVSTRPREQAMPRPVGTSGAPSSSSPPALRAAPAPPAVAIAELRSRDLRVPIDGADVERWKGSFEETHGGHRHEAVDILAPRNTPIHAVADGRVAKLFLSKPGGITVYELDTSERFMYYYAHLERYAEGLREGDAVSRGEVVGYVGTSGDAPPNTPHLHFAIFQVADPRRWWEGTAIDPYLVFAKRR